MRARRFSEFPWLVHGFSTRIGGFSNSYGTSALNLGYTPEDPRETVDRNRAAFLEALGAPGWPVRALRQIHSDLIWHSADKHPGVGDGLVTAAANTLVAIRTADCFPILLVDTRKRAVAALHAGWRGTLQRIAEKGVGEMRRRFGSRPQDLLAAIGPGIHRCCFQVGEEVRQHFQSQFADADTLFTESAESDSVRERYPLLFLTARAPGHSHGVFPKTIRLDLLEANRRQLLACGLSPRHVFWSRLCTSCHTKVLFSHRGEGGHTGRMMAVIAVRG